MNPMFPPDFAAPPKVGLSSGEVLLDLIIGFLSGDRLRSSEDKLLEEDEEE